MKNLLMMICLTGLISSCGENPGHRVAGEGTLSGELRRFENQEVICYIFKAGYKGGLSCKFKEVK